MTLLGAFPAHDHPAPDPQLARQIRVEQVRLLFAHSPLPIWLATIFAVGMGIVLQADLGAAKVWTWVVLKVAAAVPRLYQVRLYARSADRLDPIWYRSFLALLVVDGAVWGKILRYFQTENFVLSSAGIVLGMLGAAALSSVLVHQYELPGLPWHYLPAGALALWALGQLAVLGPARRAAALPPVAALRS